MFQASIMWKGRYYDAIVCQILYSPEHNGIVAVCRPRGYTFWAVVPLDDVKPTNLI